jgi:hypothetical protein
MKECLVWIDPAVCASVYASIRFIHHSFEQAPMSSTIITARFSDSLYNQKNNKTTQIDVLVLLSLQHCPKTVTRKQAICHTVCVSAKDIKPFLFFSNPKADENQAGTRKDG